MIVLLTDYGNSEFVGIMKGVIARRCPTENVADLLHGVRPQNIREGAWVLLNSFRYFPEGSVFCCVVDPGVGSERAALAIKTKDYFFVGPDNGLMFPAAEKDGIEAVISLPEEGDSKTFHGRDVFAPAAARLAARENLFTQYPAFSGMQTLAFHRDQREGEVVRIDRFGNIVTNLPHTRVGSYRLRAAEDAERELTFYETYAAAPDGELFLVEGSSRTLELSLKNGRAIDYISLHIGDHLRLEPLA